MLLLVTPLRTKVLELPLEEGMTLVESHMVCMAKALSSSPNLACLWEWPYCGPHKKVLPRWKHLSRSKASLSQPFTKSLGAFWGV